jgi:hypothetical protein
MGFPHAKGYAGQLESITFGVGNCALGHFKTLVPNTVRNGHYEHKKRKRSGRRAAEKSNHWHGWLPGTRSKRPLRPFQQTILMNLRRSIQLPWSARAISDGGIVRPNASAVFNYVVAE